MDFLPIAPHLNLPKPSTQSQMVATTNTISVFYEFVCSIIEDVV